MRSYQETLDTIYNLQGGKIDLRLGKMRDILARCGHPERSYPTLHIAGTNGKGSTASMLHQILTCEGYRIGLYTSPHLVSFTERIRIGDREISPDEVVEIAHLVETESSRTGVALTFFEFVTAMAFVYFAQRKVDAAVVEVGLGGRLDATNVISPAASLITTVSKDHEAYLGSDLLSIAREKGGIIKNGTPVVCGFLVGEVRDLLRSMAKERNTETFFLGEDFSFVLKENGLFDYQGLEWYLADLVLNLRGDFQRANAAVSLAALECVHRVFRVGERAIREGLRTAFCPGRFEVVGKRPTIVLDGAHNGEGIRVLVEEVRKFLPGKRPKILFGVMKDKDWPLMLNRISPLAREMVMTRIPMERSAAPEDLVHAVAADVPATIKEDPRSAMAYLLENSSRDDFILVAGSLYLLGEVRPYLLEIASRSLSTESG